MIKDNIQYQTQEYRSVLYKHLNKQRVYIYYKSIIYIEKNDLNHMI